jgi:hypothetical protein
MIAIPAYPAGIHLLIPLAGLMIPITALMIPIVAIWSAHRRKVIEMNLRYRAEAGAANSQSQAEVQALRPEVRELREQLHAQVITMDGLISNQARLLESAGQREQLPNRLGGGQDS